jgi:NitT/TauT family transport system permease protein
MTEQLLAAALARVAPRKPAPKSLLRRRPELVLSPLLLVVVLGAWQVLVPWLEISDLILPTPSAIVRSLWSGFASGLYGSHALVTIGEAASGFAIASLMGLLVGAAIAQSKLAERVIYPYLVALQTIPKIAIAPLIIIWFGYGMSSKIVVSAMLAFFPVLVNVIVGLKSCDAGKLDVMRSLSASPLQIFWMLRLPNALPFVFAGLNIAVIFSLLGAIVGEFVGAQKGIGSIILQANASLDVPRIFSLLAVLSAIGLTSYVCLELLRRRILFWSDTDRLTGL